MNTKFQIGDKVVAETTAQGMTVGSTYKVINMKFEYTAFGTFVVYMITDGVKDLTIGNGHMLLSKAVA
jgi:hypothetical protein